MRNPFWRSAKELLKYRLLLGVAALGAAVSALSFGAGIALLLPIFKLLLQDQQPLDEWLREIANDESTNSLMAGVADDLAGVVPSDAFASFVLVMVVIVVLTLVGSAGRYVHQLSIITIAMRTVQQWRLRLYKRLIRMPMATALKRGTSDPISRVINDTTQMGMGFELIMGKSVEAFSKGLIALSVAFFYNFWLTCLALVGLPLIAVIIRKFGKTIRKATTRELAYLGGTLNVLTESLSNLRVVKMYNAEGYERRRYFRVVQNVWKQQLRKRQAKALSSPVVDSLALIGVVLVASAAAWQIFRVQVDPEVFMTTLVALVAAAASLKPITNFNNELQAATAAATRVLDMYDELEEEPGGFVDGQAIPVLPRHQREVRVEQLRYTYPGADGPAVDGVSFAMEHGQSVAIVGGNGSGKTTVVSMLCRLIEPEQGRITVDGVDIFSVNLRRYRDQIGMVSQRSVLFHDTVANNIAYGRRHVSREQIIAAARAAYADEFIEQLEDGYDTMIGEGGEGLSGGQAQRLCIARAILHDPAILILDEATSQIDADSEQKIVDALDELKQGRTTIAIAHRMSTVIHSDLIVVMDEGRVVAQGTHEELVEKSIQYQVLVKTQLGVAETAG